MNHLGNKRDCEARLSTGSIDRHNSVKQGKFNILRRYKCLYFHETYQMIRAPMNHCSMI